MEEQKKKEDEKLEILYGKKYSKKAKRMALSIILEENELRKEDISKIVGVSTRQIYTYVNEYKQKGIAGIIEDTRYRPESKLEDYTEELKEYFNDNPPATANEARERIEELTGIKRGLTQTRNYLHKIGLKPLSIGQIPAKANPTEQIRFLEEELEPRIEEAEKGKRVVLFMDAAHFVWALYIGILWCFSRIFVQSPNGRQRINVLGAYDPIKKKIIKIVNRTYINSNVICEMLNKIRKEYGEKVITIVLDNARYQHCSLVKEVAKKLNIELLFLPTYSPNLNLIERLWKFIKKECLYSKYYETANNFESSIITCLENVNSEDRTRKKLDTLMTCNFQLFEQEKLEKIA